MLFDHGNQPILVRIIGGNGTCTDPKTSAYSDESHWPGCGENSCVLKWVSERLNGTADADLQAITSVAVDGWREAVPQIRDHYAAFGDRLPTELATALDALERSLS